jgi:hypothetical protein
MARDIVKSTDQDVLEALVDRYSLANVIEALVAICSAKEDHVREAWQDQDLARGWAADARTLDRVIAKLWNAG